MYQVLNDLALDAVILKQAPQKQRERRPCAGARARIIFQALSQYRSTRTPARYQGRHVTQGIHSKAGQHAAAVESSGSDDSATMGMSEGPTPILRDVVLLGGGHPHVEVLRQFGMRPLPGVRLTLIAASVETPYRCSAQCHAHAALTVRPGLCGFKAPALCLRWFSLCCLKTSINSLLDCGHSCHTFSMHALLPNSRSLSDWRGPQN